MNTVVIALIAFVGLAECDHVADSGGNGAPASFPSANSYSGSELRTIAQGSAHEAQVAAASQQAAASQASYVAKNTLAESASRAAATAHAALAAKEILLRNLQQQVGEAHSIFRGEIEQLQLSQLAAGEAANAAEKAASHVSVLTIALNSASNAAFHADEAAKEAAIEVASQTDMVAKAKYRLQAVEEHLNSIRLEYAATQAAAKHAVASAQQAQQNAADIRVHAASKAVQGTAAKQQHPNEIPTGNYPNSTPPGH